MTSTVVGPGSVDPVDAPDAAPSAFRALRHRDFSLFTGAAAISNTGSWMQTITVPYVVYQMTGSTTWLGIVAFVTFFPAMAIGPISGAIADRFSRRRVLLVMQVVQMGTALGLWSLWVSGAATPGNICAVLLLSSVASGINITSWQSFVPSLVPRDDLLSAVRINSVQFTAARTVGPAISGLVLARFGAGTAIMVNVVSFVVVIAALLAVRTPPNATPAVRETFLHQFRAGVSYVRARSGLVLCVATMFTVSVLASAMVQLAPAFASDQFEVAEAGYGALVAAYGFGAIVGSTVLTAIAEGHTRASFAMFGLTGSGAGVLLLGVAPNYGAGLASLFVMGAAYVFVTISLNTSIQASVDDAYRGRVVSLYLMALLGGVPVGGLLLGRAAETFGMRPTVLGSGAVLLVYVAVLAGRFRSLRAIDDVAT